MSTPSPITHDLITHAEAGDPDAMKAVFEASKDGAAARGNEPIIGVDLVAEAKGDMAVLRLVRAGVPSDAA
jgi:hypothetical protein